MTPDITNRADLDQLIEIVYGRVFADELIGPFFTQVARVMPETRAPPFSRFLGDGAVRQESVPP